MSRPPVEEAQGGGGVRPSETLLTIELLQRAQQGDSQAIVRIMERYLPRLQRWARGRLPNYARSLFDTSDLVQETLARTLRALDHIEVQGVGGFEAYVRQMVLNGIRDQIRQASIRPRSDQEPESLVHHAPSPLENAIGAELLARYDRGMAALSSEDRRLVHLRVELELEYSEIAALTGRPSRDAARMAFQRALIRLSDAMGHE